MHIHLIRLLFAALLLGPIASLFANGGPIDYSSVERTGDVRLIDQQEVRLLSEDLNITVEREYVRVEVVYRLRSSYNRTDLEYGFPIDLSADEELGKPVWQGSSIEDFQWSLDGEALDYKWHEDKSTFMHTRKVNSGQVEVPCRRWWFLGKLDFEATQTHTLRVSYRVRPRFVDWMTSKDIIPSFEPRSFVYDLRPARHWRDQPLEFFHVKLDLTQALTCGKVDWVKGLDLKPQAAGIYELNLTTQKLPDAVLDLRYDVSGCLLSQEIRRVRLPVAQVDQLKASSQLEGDYALKNLLDGQGSTAWVEGVSGVGQGEWIQVEFPAGQRIYGLMLINGYLKNESVYQANGRLKKIEIEYQGRYREEDAFETRMQVRELPDRPYRSLNAQNFGVQADPILGFGDASMEVRRIRITILDTYPGSKYDDTCVSELIVLGSGE